MGKTPVYVKLGKTIAGTKVQHADVVKRAAHQGLEQFLRKHKDLFSTVKKSKGFSLWARVTAFEVKTSGTTAQMKCSLEVHVGHLPQELRTRAKASGGAPYSASTRRLEKEIEFFVESVALQVAEKEALAYMKKAKDSL